MEQMTPEQLLKQLRTKQISEFVASDGRALRYREGKYQLKCLTCMIEKWDNIADEFALIMAERLLK
jgi:hypothetical protein